MAGSGALAIKRVIGLVAQNPNLAETATLRHRSGSFDTTTLTTDSATLKETVRLFPGTIRQSEIASGAVERGDRRYVIPAQGLKEPPALQDEVEVGTKDGRPIVWQIVQVDPAPVGGLDVAYTVLVRR